MVLLETTIGHIGRQGDRSTGYLRAVAGKIRQRPPPGAAATSVVNANTPLTTLQPSRARGDKGLEVMLAEAGSSASSIPRKSQGLVSVLAAASLLEVEGREFKALTVFQVTSPQSVDPAGPSKIKGAVLARIHRITHLSLGVTCAI